MTAQVDPARPPQVSSGDGGPAQVRRGEGRPSPGKIVCGRLTPVRHLGQPVCPRPMRGGCRWSQVLRFGAAFFGAGAFFCCSGQLIASKSSSHSSPVDVLTAQRVTQHPKGAVAQRFSFM